MFDIADSKPNFFPILATALALAYLISSIISLARPSTATKAATAKITVTQNPRLPAPQEFSLIGDFHLFGQPGSSSSSVDSLPSESTQSLKLKGVFYLPDNHAHAIIEVSDQIQKTYRVNEILPGGAILQAIDSNGIVIVANDRQQSLALTKTQHEQPEAQPNVQEQPVSPEPDNEIVIQPPESLAN